MRKTGKKNRNKLHFDYKYGFSMPDISVMKIGRGLSRDVIEELSNIKREPLWMRRTRIKSYEIYIKMHLPNWGVDLTDLNLDLLTFYKKSTSKKKGSWKDLPQEIKKTYERIGVPKAEKDFLAGVSAQYDSEVVYESVQKELKKQNIIFCDMDTAVSKYPRLVKKYFGKLILPNDNKFAALNSAVWSGGSFVYVPKGVHVKLPLQAYFRINSKNFGQFERTLIIAESDSFVHYVEGCTAPIYQSDSLHAAVVEVFVKDGARVRYSTVQNWSNNIYNLVTKRAKAERGALMEWVDCNIGSKKTMKYPSTYLVGEGARSEMLSIAYANAKQHQDSGSKMIHLAPNTSSRIISKSISKGGGRTSYRGLVQIVPKAVGSSSSITCDSLILDNKSRSDSYPTIRVKSTDSKLHHEATIEKIDEEKINYLMSRGISQSEAEGMIVNGFIEPITKEIPLEYSIELNRLIQLEMEGSVG